MQEFIGFIEKGLSTPEIKEDPVSWCIVPEGEWLSANIIGLSLIGAVGSEKAAEMSIAAFKETMENRSHDGPIIAAIGEILGISIEESENLVAHHYNMPAKEIAARLESGELSI